MASDRKAGLTKTFAIVDSAVLTGTDTMRLFVPPALEAHLEEGGLLEEVEKANPIYFHRALHKKLEESESPWEEPSEGQGANAEPNSSQGPHEKPSKREKEAALAVLQWLRDQFRSKMIRRKVMRHNMGPKTVEVVDEPTGLLEDGAYEIAVLVFHFFPGLLSLNTRNLLSENREVAKQLGWAFSALAKVFEDRHSKALSNVARGWAEEKKSVRSVSGDEVKEACRMMKYHLWLRNVLRIPPRKLGYLPGELKQLVEARVSAANLPALAVFRRAAAGTDDEDYIQSLEGELPESALVEEDNGEMVNVTWTALLASTYKELVGKKPDDTLPRLAPHAKRAMPTNSQIYERVANLLGMEDDSVRSALKRAGIKISDL